MQISKTRKNIGWVLSVIPILALLASSIAKLMNQSTIAERLDAIHITNAPLLGAIQFACITLYLIPKTANVGFFLLCSFLGGAIVGALAQGDMPLPAVGLSVLLYVGTMLRKPELSGLEI